MLVGSGLKYERSIHGGPTRSHCWQMFSWSTIGKADISERWPTVTPQLIRVAPTIECYMRMLKAIFCQHFLYYFNIIQYLVEVFSRVIIARNAIAFNYIVFWDYLSFIKFIFNPCISLQDLENFGRCHMHLTKFVTVGEICMPNKS